MKKSGFTLIELLVLLAIIAIIIGLMAPIIAHKRASNPNRTTYTPTVNQSDSSFKCGDKIVISGINKTGVVSDVDFGRHCVDVITTEGIQLYRINPNALKHAN